MKTSVAQARRLYRVLMVIGLLMVAILGSAKATNAPILPPGMPVELPKVELPDDWSDWAGTVANQQPGLYPVVHVSDGDTIIVRLPDGKEETVRLLGVDTPETKDPRRPVQCFGQAASNYTKQRLAGKSVRLEPDPTNTDRDKYHRLLRYVYLPDGSLHNADLIRDGYAFAYTVFPLEKSDEFLQLEREARAANRGLWAGCSIDESDQVKQTTAK